MSNPTTDDRDETIASLRALLRNKENELADLRRDLSRSHGRIEFANPGSALRAASSCNPRNLPCPTCGEDDRLTPEDARIGYQCDECADRAEGRGGYEWWPPPPTFSADRMDRRR